MKPKSRGTTADLLLLLALVLAGVLVLFLGYRPLPASPTVADGNAPTEIPTAVDIGPTSPIDGPTAVVLPTFKPGETGVPTAAPTVLLPPMTPLPTRISTEVRPLPTEYPLPTINPADPINLIVAGESIPNTAVTASEATIIAIGSVKEILPARWSTDDGSRPADAGTNDFGEVIYTPVIVEVEQYFKGQQISSELLLLSFGGQVGQDSMKYASDDVYIFEPGSRVFVFCRDRGHTFNGAPLCDVVGRYTITPDGQAFNSLRTTTLQQLTEEVSAVLTPSVSPAISPVATNVAE